MEHERDDAVLNRYVGQHLKLHRERMGISLERLARRLDVNAADLQNTELGLTRLPAMMLYDACEVFGISLRSFFGDLIEAQSEAPGHQTNVDLQKQLSAHDT